MSRFLSRLVFLIGLVVIQVSFLSTWPYPVNQINLVLVVVVFVTTLISYRLGLWWSFGAGLLLELSTSLPFGVITMSLLLTIVGSNFLFTHLFTNRSIYSLLAIGLTATVGYGLLAAVLAAIAGPLTRTLVITVDWRELAVQLLWQALLHQLMLVCILLSFTAISRRRLHGAHMLS